MQLSSVWEAIPLVQQRQTLIILQSSKWSRMFCQDQPVREIEGHRRYHFRKLARALKHIFSPCAKYAFVS